MKNFQLLPYSYIRNSFDVSVPFLLSSLIDRYADYANRLNGWKVISLMWVNFLEYFSFAPTRIEFLVF